MYRTDPAQHPTTAGEELHDLDHDLSDLYVFALYFQVFVVINLVTYRTFGQHSGCN